MKKVLISIDEHLRTMIRIVVWKQWKVPSARQRNLMRLGIDRDLARLTAYCGDRYQFVALKTCLKKAISKEILKKRGLLSCVNYYEDRRRRTALTSSWTAYCRTARYVAWEGANHLLLDCLACYELSVDLMLTIILNALLCNFLYSKE